MKITLLALRSILSFLKLNLVLAAGFCQAQTTGDAVPASSNVPGAKYPKIHSDLRVSFRLKAPDARKVRVHVDKDYDMERDDYAAGARVSLLLVYPGQRECVRSGQ